MTFTKTTAAVISFIISFSVVACMEKQPAPSVTALNPNQYKVDVIVDGLENPWSVAIMPNDEYLIAERNGTLKYINGGIINIVQGLPDDIFTQGQLLRKMAQLLFKPSLKETH